MIDESSASGSFRFNLAEFSGSLADLGVLLAYVAVQHALLTRDLREWLTAGPVLVLSIWTSNLAIGFASAAVVYHLWGRLASR